MNCTTIKKGVECPFQTTNGCTYNSGICHEIVEQCEGCGRGVEVGSGWYCSACPDPTIKWRNGSCNLATHVSTMGSETKQKINPLKASKRNNKR